MIAANYRKSPQAMALQLVLPFGRPVWQLPRPTTRILRAIRAARGVAFKLAGFIAYPTKPTTPQWFKDAARKARELAASVKAALLPLALNDTKADAAEEAEAEEHKTAKGYRRHQLTLRRMWREQAAKKAAAVPPAVYVFSTH